MTIVYKNPIVELEEKGKEIRRNTYTLSENTQKFLVAFNFAREAEEIANEAYRNLFQDADTRSLMQKSQEFVNEIFRLMNNCLDKNLR